VRVGGSASTNGPASVASGTLCGTNDGRKRWCKGCASYESGLSNVLAVVLADQLYLDRKVELSPGAVGGEHLSRCHASGQG
jgi:hypothetical protein